MGVGGFGVVEQVQHPALGVEALLQEVADNGALAAEHVFAGVGSEHQGIHIGHAGALGHQGVDLLLHQVLLGFEQRLGQMQAGGGGRVVAGGVGHPGAA